jgi:hypothetical protein
MVRDIGSGVAAACIRRPGQHLNFGCVVSALSAGWLVSASLGPAVAAIHQPPGYLGAAQAAFNLEGTRLIRN